MQNQTNPKPSGAPMAKLVLAVAMIVSLGVLFGAIGYLVNNKPVKVSQPQVSPVAEPAKSVIDETADWKTYKPIINPKYPSRNLLKFEFKYPSEWYYNETGIAKCGEEPDRMNPLCRYLPLYITFGNENSFDEKKMFSFPPTAVLIIAGGMTGRDEFCQGRMIYSGTKMIAGKEWHIYKNKDLENLLFYSKNKVEFSTRSSCFINFMAISSNKESESTVEKILETLKFY